MTVRWSDAPGIQLSLQVAVRPVDDHLVGVAETAWPWRTPAGHRTRSPGSRGTRPSGHRGGEVDRAEHQHARRRREGGDEHLQPFAASFAVRSVGQRAGLPVRQQPAHIVPHGIIDRWSIRAASRSGPPRPPDAGRAGRDDRRPRSPAPPVRRPPIAAASSPNSGNVLRDTGSTKRSMIPPQVSPTVKASSSDTPYRWNRAGVAVPHRGGQLVHRTLDAPSGHRPDRGAVRSDQHHRAGRPRGAERQVPTTVPTPTVSPGFPPAQQVRQHITHRGSPPAIPPASPTSARPRSDPGAATPRRCHFAPGRSRPCPCAG